MNGLLASKSDIEQLQKEYKLFSSFNFNPEFYPLIKTEEPVLEECEC